MDEATKNLIQYRLEKADEELKLAKKLFEDNYFAKSLNCSYYAMFHATRALLTIKKVDSKKHSGLIRMFNISFINNGDIPKEYFKYLSSAFNTRMQSDYHDFFIASKQDSEEQIQDAEKFLEMVKNYLSKNLDK